MIPWNDFKTRFLIKKLRSSLFSSFKSWDIFVKWKKIVLTKFLHDFAILLASED